MNLLLLVVLVSILLLVLGNPSPRRIPPSPQIPKESGYKTLTDYHLDAPSVYGAFKN
jgi:hypothetical protein